MPRCNYMMSVGIRFMVLQISIFLGSCSLLMDYDECKNDGDCSGNNIICDEAKGYCVLSEDTGPSVDELLNEDECRSPRIYGVTAKTAVKDTTILLGSVLPFSGDLSVYGSQISKGVELAVDEINQAGGILGKKVGVLFCDSGTSVETTTRAVKHFISLEKIPAVIGPASSEVASSVYENLTKDAGLVMVSPAAASSELSELFTSNLFWRTVQSDASEGAAIARYLLDEGFEKIAVVHRNDMYGKSIMDDIIDGLVVSFSYEDSEHFYYGVYDESTVSTQQSQIVVELQEFLPEVTVLLSYYDDGAAFLELATQQEIGPFFLSRGLKTDKLMDVDMPDSAFCNLAGTQLMTPTGKNYQSFTLRYKAKYGEVGPYSANAYDAVYLLSYAIAATNTVNPTGAEVAEGMTRLSSGDVVNAGSSDWEKATELLSQNPSATINYEGASGSLDFNTEEEAVSDIEAWAVNMDDEKTVSLGTLYASGAYYEGVIAAVPGQGEACRSQREGDECDNIGDCKDGHYCDLTREPPICMAPPSGQGELCTTDSDCESFDANYCETMVSGTCLVRDCSQELNNCTPGYDCCDFTFIGLPALCVDAELSGGMCQTGVTCESDDDCGTYDGSYCDLGLEIPYCRFPPTGQGRPCEEMDDCTNFQADYCETMLTYTCLQRGCDKELQNCSPGYMCCDFEWVGLPSLCVDEVEADGHCACAVDEDCRTGEYCDTDPTLEVPICRTEADTEGQ